MTTLTVLSATCPKLPDGRRRHLFRKVDGEFVCANCGQLSDPARRWEEPEQARGGHESQRGELPGRRDQDCQVLGDHASLPEEESARPASGRQQFRTSVPRTGGRS